MGDYRTTITVYSDTLTEDEFKSLLGEEFFSEDNVWELDFGVIANPDSRRYLYWQANHGTWPLLDEANDDGITLIDSRIEGLLEMRADATEVERRDEDQDANYDSVISAEVRTRGGRTEFTTILVPNTTAVMIAAIRDARRQGNEHAAWLSVEHLLAGLERGMQI